MNKTQEFLEKYISNEELNIERFATILEVDMMELGKVISEDNIDKACELTLKYAVKKNDPILYEELKAFYSKWADGSFNILIKDALKSKDKCIRLMLNSIKRLVLLADDMEKIRPKLDGLKILQLVIGIEILFKLAGYEEKDIKKHQMVSYFFNNCINEDDKNLLIKMIERDGNILTIDTIARLVSAIRNQLVHEGNFWQFHFANDDYPIILTLKFDESYQEFKEKSYYERVYEIRITYEEFKNVFVRGYIYFIGKYNRGELNIT